MTDDLRALQDHLQTRRGRGAFGGTHEHHASIGSTNDRALQWLRDGAPHGAVVTADIQTAGRGRRGRSWASPRGQLYASVIAKPPSVGPTVGALGLAVAVGLREGLPPFDVGLKWPNDLIVGGRKLGGILCEARWQGESPELVLGFGINVASLEAPPEVSSIATSLEQCGVEVVSRAALLADLLVSLESVLELFFARGFAAIRHRYEPHSVVLGQRIAIEDPAGDGKRRTVLADSFAEDGALMVRSRPGAALERIEVGDVHLGG